MVITDEQREHLSEVAKQTLDVFHQIATHARDRLHQLSGPSISALASANSFTMGAAVQQLSYVGNAEREACDRLSREPAIARVIVENDEGNREVVFISRAAAPGPFLPGVKFASYRSQVGRLAALSPGDSIEVRRPTGAQALEVIERAALTPNELHNVWDAFDTLFETEVFGPITIDSLRRLLALSGMEEEPSDELDQLLREEEVAEGIAHGRRRNIIAKMGLRDQPILDRFQDEIFRLPLDSRLAVLGPPGTGKTTTLIRRLGQKLDLANMEPEEVSLIERAASREQPHSDSWLMFTPTELLRHYVKEAFAREGVAASDRRIRTWTTHRRELGRDIFGILRTSTGGGPFVMRDNEPTLSNAAITDTIGWFDDFSGWQADRYWHELSEAAALLAASTLGHIAELGSRLVDAVERARRTDTATGLFALVGLIAEVRATLEQLRTETERHLRSALNVQLNRNRAFLDELAAFIDTLSDHPDESDDDGEEESEVDIEDGDEEPRPRTRKIVAVNAYYASLRVQARAANTQRRPSRGQAVAILQWLGDRGLPDDNLELVGRSLVLQRALRRFSNPVRAYLGGVPTRYRAFRRLRRGEGRWYKEERTGRYVNELEVDVMLLSMLRTASELARDQRIQRAEDQQTRTALERVAGSFRNQILVDEATDFSPVQLACMSALLHPAIEAFFACGDFNQRITNWGTRTEDQLKWARPDIDVREIEISYRQSRQLYDLARQIAEVSGGRASGALLPEHVDNDGVPPALALNLRDREEVVLWLAQRIVEIDAAISPRPLPSIAVLVNDEAEVQPVADALDRVLEDHNLRAVACVNGQMFGQENEVRVFDVQHIKGLEFEAVFFLGIDRLAARQEELFDKYLYVGATRAATYLGLTCETVLPERIAHLHSAFARDWN